jgi:hypothetical protein
VLFHDLRGFQELMFGAYVRNAMFFATLPYYLAQKMRRGGPLDSQGSDVSETESTLSSDTALGRKPGREAPRVTPNRARLGSVPAMVMSSVCGPDQR